MQARLRRNRIAVLVAIAVGLTCTGSIQSDGMAVLRSEAADTAYAAVIESEMASAAEHGTEDSALNQSGSQYQVYDYVAKEWWKANTTEYDDSLSLISYEAADSETDYPLTTTHISETSDFDINSTSAAEEPSDGITTITTVAEPEPTLRGDITADPGTVVFYSSGFGHGVGMSQNGANFYAKYDGWTYDKILQFYYPGTTIVQTGTPETELMTVGGKTDTVVSILSQIVNNEMGPTFSEEAIKAQAVAAYTFYLYNGYGAGMICKSKPSQKIVKCVREVLGQVVYFNGKPALTMFTASSGGATASCKDVFFMDIPYLVSFPVRHDDTADPHYCSTKTFTVNALKTKLQNAYHVTLTGGPSDWIQLEFGDGGYVAYAVIGGKVRVKGNALRAVLGLKSPKYGFVYNEGNASTVVPIHDPDSGAYTEPATVPDIVVSYTKPVTTTAITTTEAQTTTSTTESAVSETTSSTVSTETTSSSVGTTTDTAAFSGLSETVISTSTSVK